MLLLLTNIIIGFIEVLLGLRVVLKLFGANAESSFVSWVYQASYPLLSPFEGIFPTSRFSGSFVIEFSAIFAIILYAVAGYLVEEMIDYINLKRIRFPAPQDKTQVR